LKKIVVYLNQFFGQIGGEDIADYEPTITEGAVGPAAALQAKITDAEVVHTVICGDNYMSSHTEEALTVIGELLKGKEFDLFAAGPAFQAGRYGFACCTACLYVEEKFGVPVVTSMYEGNPAVDLYRMKMYIVKGHDSAAKMRKDLVSFAKLINKILSGEMLLGADAEEYFPRGIRQEVTADRPVVDRVMDMLFKKLSGEPFETEIYIEKEDRVSIALPVNTSETRVAFITTSGFVPKGNPDHITSGSCTYYGEYNLSEYNSLIAGDYESVHGGYDHSFTQADPNVLVPWDALNQHVKAGNIKSLHPVVYSLSGNQTAKDDAKRMAQEILAKLGADVVGAVLLDST